MFQRNTKDNENGRRRRDRPLGLSNRKGTNLKVCPYSVVFGGDFRVKFMEQIEQYPFQYLLLQNEENIVLIRLMVLLLLVMKQEQD